MGYIWDTSDSHNEDCWDRFGRQTRYGERSMTTTDLKVAIRQAAPTTKASRLRSLMPDIECRVAEGVQLRTIHKALVDAGFDLTFQTLKTYLYRHRKKQQIAGQQGQSLAGCPSDAMALTGSAQSISYETEANTPRPSGGPVSILELDRLMKPDPAQQAADLARYERIAKQQRRNRK
jgi:hypothetical protein